MKKESKKMSKKDRHKKMMPLMSFMEMLKRKLVSWDEIDDFIDLWHLSNHTSSLHEFLGMSLEEYKLWVQNPALSHHISYVNRFDKDCINNA